MATATTNKTTIKTDVRNTQTTHVEMKAAELLKAEKDIALGRQLITMKTDDKYRLYTSAKKIRYTTWKLFLQGVFGWEISYANRFINAALQYDRLHKLKLTDIAQPIDTLWTCRRLDDKVIIAAWTNITKGDKTVFVYDEDLHKQVSMHESVKERDTRDRRVTARMLESEFVRLVDAVNDRISVVNKKLKTKKNTKLTAEPTYTFDSKTRTVVDSLGVVYEVKEWLEHVADYLEDTNRI